MPADRDEITRQVQGHLFSLREAGVEWLPAGPPLALELAADITEQPSAAAASQVGAQPASTGSLEERRTSLEMLAKEVSACCRCGELASTRTQTVFGRGGLGVDLCFVGEAPGADEDAKGQPFVGAAGQLLSKIIAASGFKEDEVYICNILKCRPPGNRTPLPNEASNCRSFLERQIDLVAPRFLCALGSCAAQNLLNTSTSIGKLRGRFHDYRGIPVLVTYHPAYLLPHRSPDKKRDVWEDMKMLLARMGRPIPAK
jgi:uracil-DNA glycosylase